MAEWIPWFRWDFMWQALVASLFASIACGIVGSLVVVNRIVYLAGGIAHAAYGGVGFALFLSLPILPVVISFSIVCALLLGLITFSRKHHTDALVSVLWSVGMALGVILVNLTPGYQADLMGYLFGSILTILPSDVLILVGLDVMLLLWVLILYWEIVAVSYDMEYAQVIGIPAVVIYYLILVLTAITVILLMRFVGLILVIAMLSIPSYLAERWSGSLKSMMFLSGGITLCFMVSGLIVSYELNLPPGAVMILIAGLCFVVSEMIEHVRKQGQIGRS